MKNLITILVFTLSIFLLLVGCTPKPIDIELEQLEQKPVIWSQIIPGNFVLFYFSRSFSSLNEYQDSTTSQDFLNQILVDDGSMSLTHDENTEELIQLSSGIWINDGITTPLNVGDFYTLKGTDNLLGKSISSTTQLMPTITLSNQFVTEKIEDDSVKISRIEYHINDVPGKNWYLLNVYSGDLNNIGNLGDSSSNSAVEVASQIVTDQIYNTFDITNEIIVFDHNSDTLLLSLSNITEEYYNYLALRERGGSIISQLTSEPINYPSNVENGYGYFNLVVPDFKTVIVE